MRRAPPRVAWTGTWQTARAFLREQLRGLPVTVRMDAAGNQWARLPGSGSGVVIIGSHLDSVPDGGWLDGAYGVMCAVEVCAPWRRVGRCRARSPWSSGRTRKVPGSGIACSARQPWPER